MKKSQRIVLNMFDSSHIVPSKIRVKMLQLCGISFGSNFRILSGGFYDTSNMKIGNNTLINRYVKFYDGDRNERIEIGSNVMIAMGVTLCSVTHEIGQSIRRGGKPFSKPIIIEDGCWIGANTTVLPNVTISKGCVVAAGSVVTKSTEPNGLYAGVPAKRVKKFD